MKRSAFEQSVRVGDADRVHVRSAFKTNETRCGLQMVPPLYFTNTDEVPTCPFCQRPPAARKSA